MDEKNLSVLLGTTLATAVAVQELIAALPAENPVRARLRAARDTQERALRELGQPEPVLFACERAWQTLLPE